MTVVAIARRRLTAAIVFGGLLLVMTGLMLGFALARFVSNGGLNDSAADHTVPIAVTTPGYFGGLSPDDRQVLRDGAVASPAKALVSFGGLSPDDRQLLRDGSGAGSATTSGISGGLSPDERDEARNTR